MKVKTFNYVIAYRAYADAVEDDALGIFEISSDFIEWTKKSFKLFCAVSAVDHSLHALSFYIYEPRVYSNHKLISDVWDIISNDGWGWFKSLSVEEGKLIRTHGEITHISNGGVAWDSFDKTGMRFTSDWISFEDLRSCISPVQMLIERELKYE